MTTIQDLVNDFRKGVAQMAPGASIEIEIKKIPLPVITQFHNEKDEDSLSLHSMTEGETIYSLMRCHPLEGVTMESVPFNPKSKLTKGVSS